MALIFHAALLGFFGLGEILVDILDVEKGPGLGAAFEDGLVPGCLGGEICGAVKVSDGWLYGGKIIDVIDDFCWGRSVVAARRDVGCDGMLESREYTELRDSKPDGILRMRVSVCSFLTVCFRGDSPHAGARAPPSFQDGFL